MKPPPTSAVVSRRSLLQAALFARLAATGLAVQSAFASGAAAKKILLCSGWQFVNIGDLAQTIGGLRLLGQWFPDADLTLWLAHGSKEVSASIASQFPKVRIVVSSIDPKTLAVHDEALRGALAEADLVVHGSGPIAMPELLDWCQSNKKKYGLLGVTLGNMDEKTRVRLSNAAFVFCRESLSLDAINKAHVKGPKLGFFPDAALAMEARDDASGLAFLKSAGLEAGKFVCVVPRLRLTPFRHFSPEQIQARARISEEFAEPDHGKLRAVMEALIRKAQMKVLVCPEMTYELEIFDRLLIDPLSAEVKANVVKRATFWQPDEAASVYRKAAAVVSFEFHTPLLAIAAGTPAIHLRQPTDTRKGQMLRDIGLGDWVFEIDDASGEKISQAALTIVGDLAAAKAKVGKAMDLVALRFKEAATIIQKSAGA